MAKMTTFEEPQVVQCSYCSTWFDMKKTPDSRVYGQFQNGVLNMMYFCSKDHAFRKLFDRIVIPEVDDFHLGIENGR